MSSLERVTTDQDDQVTASLCTLLATVLGRINDSVIRRKFQACSTVLTALVERHQLQAAIVKPALTSLSQSLAAADTSDWPSAAKAFQTLLLFSLDSRPKVRKQAQAGLARVCAAWQDTSAAAEASSAVQRMCERVLPGPEAAARAASQASGKDRGAAESAISAAVTDALHLLGTLTTLLPLLTGPPAGAILQLVQKLYFLRQPLLSRNTTAALNAACTAPQAEVHLTQLLSALLDNSSAWEGKDADTALSLANLLESGLSRLHDTDASASERLLPHAAARLLPQMSAAQEGVRLASSRCLSAIISICFDEGAVTRAAAAAPDAHARAGGRVVELVAEALEPRAQAGWLHVLPVAATLLQSLGSVPSGALLAPPLISRLGDLCAGAADSAEAVQNPALAAVLGDGEAAEEASGGGDGIASKAEAAMGAAIAALGPEAVLAVLPLNLIEGLAGTAEPRTWLIPILNSYVQQARLQFWFQQILPLARVLGEASAKAPIGMVKLQTAALEAQLWGCLSSFAIFPHDAADAFRANARQLGGAFEKRPDLRPSIAAALVRLCRNARAHTEDQVSQIDTDHADIDSDVGEEGSDADADASTSMATPAWYTAEVADRDAKALKAFAKNWLPLLFNAFVASEAAERGPIAAAIGAYACVAEPEIVASFFRAVMQKLIKATHDANGTEAPAGLQQNGSLAQVETGSPTERRCTYLDLGLCLAPGLDDRALHVLVTAALPALQERDQALQKRAYKLLAHACNARGPAYPRAHLQPLLDALLAGVGTAMSAAKRWRLDCLKAIVLVLLSPDADWEGLRLDGDEAEAGNAAAQRRQVVSALVGEIVLCTKEVNQKTRAAAFQLLIALAKAMHAAEPPAPQPFINDGDASMAGDASEANRQLPQGGLPTLLTMVMGGLVGTSPHMISATVLALARLLHEFAPVLEAAAPRLLTTVLMLLRTKSREVVKAVLGFCKVCAMRLPVDQLEPQLKPMLEGLLIWAEDSKNKFRLKVRGVVERLVRRCGFDAVAAAFPHGDSKLLSHIQKMRGRRERSKGGESKEGTLDGRTLMTKGGSTWGGTSKMLGGSERGGAKTENPLLPSQGGLGRKAKRAASVMSLGGKSAKQAQRQLKGLALSSDGDPINLMEPTHARAMAAAAAARPSSRHNADDDSSDGQEGFEADEGGRYIINDDRRDPAGRLSKGRLRDRNADSESDLEDEFDDLRARGRPSVGRGGHTTARGSSVGGLTRGRGGARSMTVRSGQGGASRGGRGGGNSNPTRGVKRKGRDGGSVATHSGDRFKARKTAGGDVKGSSRVEPYAYWPLDRKALNKRPAKQAHAAKGLSNIVRGAKKGAAQGTKRRRALPTPEQPIGLQNVAHRRPPVFPDAFQVYYNFSLPFESTMQSNGLTYDVRVWRDAQNKRHRMDTYGGSNLLIATQEGELEVVPRKDKLACLSFQPDASDSLLGAPILPDVRTWEYKGRAFLRNQDSHLWEREERHESKHTVYKFYVTEEGAPLRLHMQGNDLLSGAHFDKYIADYIDYIPGPHDSAVFETPALCKSAAVEAAPAVRPFLLRMAALLPAFATPGGDAEYDAFVSLHGRRHTSPEDYSTRREVFHVNRALVAQANADANLGYTTTLNRFADWSQEEFEAVMLSKQSTRSPELTAAKHHSAELPYERKVPVGRVPGAVDWRGTPADTSVKDQAVCGSCWAFSTTGTMQGAYFLATGNTSSFSEQQLMDCSWGHGANKACDGGDQDRAMDYVVEAGGVAPEASYTYMGADGFCRDKNVSHDALIKFKGFAYVPEYDDEALMEAVYSRGPVAVSLDASQPGFRFYSDGVYESSTCFYKPDDLDHAVLVVGYGTSEKGHDYWIIRNSWSTYWGDEGYIKISRHGPGKACGITSGPMYAVVA
ncbi:hypothetical protein WJX73_008694 [Symbiochloris irregularis]|uniref:Uncharacterized protein n=1 Tax=Symbiochloris irregularis TaxID=706552 RepID=A0AAW1Q4L3_9CHLO